jgi:(2Fe-2S) ferredoxin
MRKPRHHILVCTSSRVSGEPKGACAARDGVGLIPYLEGELADRGMDDVLISNTGCLKVCDKGPVMVIYPEGDWYGNLSEAAIDDILDSVQEGGKAEAYLL